MTEKEFDQFYGKGAYRDIIGLVSELAPCTRRDEWWRTIAPYEIIAQWVHRRSAH